MKNKITDTINDFKSAVDSLNVEQAFYSKLRSMNVEQKSGWLRTQLETMTQFRGKQALLEDSAIWEHISPEEKLEVGTLLKDVTDTSEYKDAQAKREILKTEQLRRATRDSLTNGFV